MTDDDGLTTGRRMSTHLADALDNCPDRKATIRALHQLADEGAGRLATIYGALALELTFVELREAMTLHEMETALVDPGGA